MDQARHHLELPHRQRRVLILRGEIAVEISTKRNSGNLPKRLVWPAFSSVK